MSCPCGDRVPAAGQWRLLDQCLSVCVRQAGWPARPCCGAERCRRGPASVPGRRTLTSRLGSAGPPRARPAPWPRRPTAPPWAAASWSHSVGHTGHTRSPEVTRGHLVPDDVSVGSWRRPGAVWWRVPDQPESHWVAGDHLWSLRLR